MKKYTEYNTGFKYLSKMWRMDNIYLQWSLTSLTTEVIYKIVNFLDAYDYGNATYCAQLLWQHVTSCQYIPSDFRWAEAIQLAKTFAP